MVPNLEQGLSNSRKSCKFHIQTSLSGTFTGDTNGGEEHTLVTLVISQSLPYECHALPASIPR